MGNVCPHSVYFNKEFPYVESTSGLRFGCFESISGPSVASISGPRLLFAYFPEFIVFFGLASVNGVPK